MATFQTSGMDGWEKDLDKLMLLPDEVIKEMVEVQAEEVEKEIVKAGRKLGVQRTGVTLSSIKVGKIKKTASGYSVEVTPEGSRPNGRKSKRNAEVAFINNFGKQSQKARPFWDRGTFKGAATGYQKMVKIHDNYIDKNIGK